jgi:hypothetical protein
MEERPAFSHGLLYSVAPENFPTLHLNDDARQNEFDWEAYETGQEGDSYVQIAFNLLKITAIKWGLTKLH